MLESNCTHDGAGRTGRAGLIRSGKPGLNEQSMAGRTGQVGRAGQGMGGQGRAELEGLNGAGEASWKDGASRTEQWWQGMAAVEAGTQESKNTMHGILPHPRPTSLLCT